MKRRPRQADAHPALRTIRTAEGALLASLDNTTGPLCACRISLATGLSLVCAEAGAHRVRIACARGPERASGEAATWAGVVSGPVAIDIPPGASVLLAHIPARAIGPSDKDAPGIILSRRASDTVVTALVRAAMAASLPDRVLTHIVAALGLHHAVAYSRCDGALGGEGFVLSDEQLGQMKLALLGGGSLQAWISGAADACGVSVRELRRAFLHATGVAPGRWRLLRMLEAARDAVAESGQSLSQIAHAHGFTDQSHLSRHFCAQFGLPPGQWRRRTQAART